MLGQLGQITINSNLGKLIYDLCTKYFEIMGSGTFMLLLLLLKISVYSQVTIFSENCGVGTSLSISLYNGWNNNGSYTFTGNASVRNTPPSNSTAYAGASGGSYIFFNTTSPTFEISGIDTRCYLDAFLSVGIYKNNTTSNGSDFIIEVSEDGITYNPLIYTLPTGISTNRWYGVNLVGNIPLVSNLYIRFRQTSSSTQYRIDDINLAGIQNITDSFISNCMGFMYDSIIYTQDSVYLFNEIGWNGCDSFGRICTNQKSWYDNYLLKDAYLFDILDLNNNQRYFGTYTHKDSGFQQAKTYTIVDQKDYKVSHRIYKNNKWESYNNFIDPNIETIEKICDEIIEKNFY